MNADGGAAAGWDGYFAGGMKGDYLRECYMYNANTIVGLTSFRVNLLKKKKLLSKLDLY